MMINIKFGRNRMFRHPYNIWNWIGWIKNLLYIIIPGRGRWTSLNDQDPLNHGGAVKIFAMLVFTMLKTVVAGCRSHPYFVGKNHVSLKKFLKSIQLAFELQPCSEVSNDWWLIGLVKHLRNSHLVLNIYQYLSFFGSSCCVWKLPLGVWVPANWPAWSGRKLFRARNGKAGAWGRKSNMCRFFSGRTII
jgi:hypothetical protein